MPCPSYPLWFDHCINIWWRALNYEIFCTILLLPPSQVQILSSAPCSQQSSSFLQGKRQSFTHIQKNGKIIFLHVLIIIYFDGKIKGYELNVSMNSLNLICTYCIFWYTLWTFFSKECELKLGCMVFCHEAGNNSHSTPSFYNLVFLLCTQAPSPCIAGVSKWMLIYKVQYTCSTKR
jgi:hypothetical protein